MVCLLYGMRHATHVCLVTEVSHIHIHSCTGFVGLRIVYQKNFELIGQPYNSNRESVNLISSDTGVQSCLMKSEILRSKKEPAKRREPDLDLTCMIDYRVTAFPDGP